MSGLAVRVRTHPDDATSAGAELLLNSISVRGPDRQTATVRGSVEVAHAALHTTREAHKELFPVQHPTNDMWVVADARIDDQARLRDQLTAAGCTFEPKTDADLILAAHEVWGDEAQRELVGDFAYVVWNGQALIAARDVMGMKPLLWTVEDDGSVCIASTLRCLLDAAGASVSFNERHIVETLVRWPSNRHDTPYSGINRLEPGQRLRLVPGSEPDLVLMDEIRMGSLLSVSDAEAASMVRSVLNEAVTDRMRSPGRVGCDVSGGFDSSTIFALAWEHAEPDGVVALSDVFPGLTCDESEYIDAVLDDRSAPSVRLDASATDPEELENQVRADGEIPRYPESCGALYARAKAMGCATVLTGQGGDEALSFSDGYWADAVAMRGIRAVVNATDGEGWRYRMRLGIGVGRELGQRQLLHRPHLGPLISRLRQVRRRRSYPWVTDRLWKALPGDPDVGARPTEWAIGRSRRLYSYISPTSTLDYESIDRDIAGIVEVRHPFVDRRFVELILRLPSDVLNRNNAERHLHRLAFADVLPQRVLERDDKAEFSERYPAVVQHVLSSGIDTHEQAWTRSKGLLDEAGRDLADLNKGWAVICVSSWLRHCIAPNGRL